MKKTNLPKQNMRYRGPIESCKLNNAKKIMFKNITDLIKLYKKTEKDIDNLSLKRNVINNTINKNLLK